MTLDAPSPHKYSYLWPHIEGPCLGGFKVPVTMGTNPLSYPARVTRPARMLSNTKWFFRNAAEGFYFPCPEFFQNDQLGDVQINPMKYALNQGTTITCTNVYHWGVQLCYQHPDPADTLTALAFAKYPTWQKPSWRSVKRRREKVNRPPEWLIEGWRQVTACSHQSQLKIHISYRMTEPSRLEETFEIIKSICQRQTC